MQPLKAISEAVLIDKGRKKELKKGMRERRRN